MSRVFGEAKPPRPPKRVVGTSASRVSPPAEIEACLGRDLLILQGLLGIARTLVLPVPRRISYGRPWIETLEKIA
jgi:hypothetical protein